MEIAKKKEVLQMQCSFAVSEIIMQKIASGFVCPSVK
jgi:hypothetical protein